MGLALFLLLLEMHFLSNHILSAQLQVQPKGFLCGACSSYSNKKRGKETEILKRR